MMLESKTAMIQQIFPVIANAVQGGFKVAMPSAKWMTSLPTKTARDAWGNTSVPNASPGGSLHPPMPTEARGVPTVGKTSTLTGSARWTTGRLVLSLGRLTLAMIPALDLLTKAREAA